MVNVTVREESGGIRCRRSRSPGICTRSPYTAVCVGAHESFPDALLMEAVLCGAVQHLRLGLAFDLVKTYGAGDGFVGDNRVLYSLCI